MIASFPLFRDVRSLDPFLRSMSKLAKRRKIRHAVTTISINFRAFYRVFTAKKQNFEDISIR